MRLLLTGVLMLLSLPRALAQFPGCPDVNAGADQNLSCSTPCANLTATPFPAGATTSYTVASIPHTPPIAYNAAGGTGVSVGTDDVWSPQINLPFNFCYYGVNYNNCKIGSNGSIKFNAGSGGSQAWSFTASCPSTALSSVGDIFGIYHDIDPSVGGTVNWYVTGTAPCRIFVVSYNAVPHFSCTSISSTFMMVLYETTNVIDVYVQDKPLCSSWNGGRAIIGIQDPANGNVGLTAPGRNTSPTWTVSTPEAWRFTPSGAPIYTVEWFEGATSLGTSTTINVCPVVPTTYTAKATYTACDGTVIVKTDDVLVTPNPGMPSGSVVTIAGETCSGTLGSVTVQASGGSGSGYQYSIDNGTNWQASGSFSNLTAGNYTVMVQDGNGCQGGIPVTITPPSTSQPVNAGPDQTVCQGVAVTLSGSGVQSYTWDNGVTNGVAFVPTGTQTYVVTGTDINGCTDTDTVLVTVTPAPNVQAGPDRVICAGDALILTATGASTYSWTGGITNGVSFAPSATQTYTVTGTDASGCQSTAQVQVTVNPLPVVSAGADQSACIGNNITLLGSGAQTYVWNNGVVDGTPFIPGLTQTYTVTGTDANGCQNSDQVTVTIVPYPTADIGSDVTEGYPTLIVNFTNNSTNATAYQWNFGNGNTNAVSTTAGQQSSYPTPGDYVVILTASNGGCIDTDSLKIHVFPFLEPSYVLPNIITPNGDKVNDYFFIDAANVKNIKVMINNRWGNKIAEYEGLTGLWDGTINGNPAAEGVYFVRYEIEDLYGNIIKGQGNVELIR